MMLHSLLGNSWKTQLSSILLLLFCSIIPLNAALIDYNFSSTVGTYQEITGGTEFTLLNGTTYADDQKFVDPAVLNGGSGVTGVGFPIGFNFTFNESVFDVVAINNNGWISFGQSSLGATAVNMSSSTSSVLSYSTSSVTPAILINRIAALNRDLQAQASSSLRIQTIGSAPNQVCVIQWKNYKRFSTSGTGDSLSFQIRLYQNSNKVEIAYGQCASGSTVTASTIIYQVGLRGPAISDFSVRSTIDNWANTTSATLNTATCQLDQTVFPANGLTFSWLLADATTPPNPAVIISPVDLDTDVSYLPTLQWSSGGGLPTGYKLNVGTDNPPTNLINNLDLNNVQQYSITNQLNFLTNYYWQVVPYNSYGPALNCPVWSFTTQENDVITPPYVQNFSNATYPPNFWTRFTGLLAESTTMTSATIGWVTNNNFGNVTNSPNAVATKLNNYGTSRKHWLVTPPINLGTGTPYKLEFDLALTDNNNANPIENTNGIDDKFAVVISTDNGVTWSSTNILKLWDNDSSTASLAYDSIATAGQRIAIDLTPYSGMVKIGFYGESTVTNTDNDIHLDNVTLTPISNNPIYFAVPNNKNFGTIHINNTSVSQDFAIQNLSVGTLIINNISLVGDNASDFTLVNNNTMPASALYGNPITISVKFSPLTTGQKNASIQITDNLGRVVHSIPLIGNAIDATITAFPTTENFDSITIPYLPTGWDSYINSTSTGTVNTYTSTTAGIANSVPNVAKIYNASDLTGNYILLSPPVQNTNLRRAKFFARATTAGTTLSVGYMTNSGDISTFTEISNFTLTTTHAEYLVSLGNAPAGNQRIAFKHGNTGTSRSIYIDDVMIETLPASAEIELSTNAVEYGTIYANRETLFPVVITNNGQETLNVNWTLPASVAIYPPNPTVCNGGQSITVNVGLLPTLAQMGEYSQNIIINTNDPLCPTDTITITATVLGPLPDGMVEIGNGTATGYALPMDPYYNYSYSQSIYTASQLNISQNQRIIQVAYNFNGSTAYSDSIKIYMANTALENFNSPNTWIPANDMQLVYNGTLATSTTPGWITLDLTNYFNYTAGSNLAIAVYEFQAEGSHTTANEYFCTATANSQSIEYHNDTTLPDPANPPTSITRRAYIPNTRLLFTPEPTGPMFYVTPASKEFAQTQISLHSAYQTFTVRNIGLNTLSLSSIELSGTDPTQFQLLNSNTLPVNLTTNQTATFQVRFAPTSVGAKSATVLVTDNVTRIVRTIVLNGIAYDAMITTLPHLENFDAVTAPEFPFGWQYIKNTTATSAYANIYSSTSTGIVHSAPNVARLANSTDANAELLIISPLVQELNSKRVKFFARGGSATNVSTLSVGYITDPMDASTFTEISSIPLTGTHTEYIVSFATVPAGNKQIAFKHGLTATSRTIYFDDVNITLIPATPEIALNPTTLDFGNLFANSNLTNNINITNNGTQPLTVNWTLPVAMTIIPAGITTIQAGTTSSIQVSFSPTATEIGNYAHNISLATNDPSTPAITIPVTATVLAPLPTGLYQIGVGTATGNALPTDPFYKYSYSQSIYLANELPNLTGQSINMLGYQFNGNSAFEDSINVYMGYTSFTNFTSPNTFVPADSLQLVYHGPLTTTTNVDEWIMLQLNPGFEFIPGRNLVIAVHEFMNTLHGTNDEFLNAASSSDRSVSYRSDSINPDPTTPPTPTRKSFIPNTRLFIGTNYPRPTNLTSSVASGIVNLSWTAPAQGRNEVEVELKSEKSPALVNKKMPSSSHKENNPTRMTLTNYKVYRNELEIALTPANTTNFTDTDVVNNTTYNYKVTAVYTDPAGESFPSNTCPATPVGSVLNPPVALTASSTGSTIQLSWALGELKMYEGFNLSTLPENWSLMDLDNDGNNWISSDINPHSGQKCIESISTGLNPNNWLITPSITLGNNPILSWWVGGQDGTQLGDQYRIYISTSSSTNFENQLYQEVLTSGNWTRKSLNLNSYSNQTVYLAFTHRNSANKQKIRLDDIALSSSMTTAKSGKEASRNLTGFKIYRDNSPIGDVTSSTLSYLDVNPSAGSHLYYVTALYDEGESIASNFINMTDENSTLVPTNTSLKGNYPNPFNPVTTIAFDLAQDQNVNIEIYNVKGQKVKSLINENKKAGSYRIVWNGTNDYNSNVGSGIYFYRMKSGNYTSTGKMILMK